jgi:hypothetical protein
MAWADGWCGLVRPPGLGMMAEIELPSMVTARPGSPSRSAPPGGSKSRRVRSGWDWRVWWLVGLCFGLGYGVSHRLLNLGGEAEKGASQRFDVQPFPGTSLDSLRQRFGGEPRDIRGDLDLLELEEQKKQDAAEIEKRRAAIEEREARERERLLEGFDAPTESGRGAEPSAGEAESPPAPSPPTPAPQTPPAREREAAAPAPVAPPPVAPPPLTPPPAP